MKHFLSLSVLALLSVFLALPAHADVGSGSSSAVISAGSGSAVAAVVTATTSSATVAVTADQVHDVLSSPAAAFDDVKAARKIGWPALVFVVALILARLAGKLGAIQGWPALAKLNTGKVAVVVGGIAAIAAAGYNAAASGGSAIAIATGAFFALATFYNSHAGDGKPA
jgi:hypothetical protein